MFAAGFQDRGINPHTVERDLMHGLTVPTWDGLKSLKFFVIGDPDNPSAKSGTFPGPTVRMPRGCNLPLRDPGQGAAAAHHPLARHGADPHERRRRALLHGDRQLHLPVAAQLHRHLLRPLPPQHHAALRIRSLPRVVLRGTGCLLRFDRIHQPGRYGRPQGSQPVFLSAAAATASAGLPATWTIR